MTHQSRLLLLPAWHDIIIDLNDIVSVERVYYPGHNRIDITLRTRPTSPITIGETHMEKCWEILCKHTINPPCPPNPANPS